MCQQNSHGTKGCRAHVEALAGLLDALLPVSRLVEVPGISRDVPAKTLTEQEAAAHVQACGCCNNPCWEVLRLLKVSEISGDVPAKILTEQGAAAHMSKHLDVVTARAKGWDTRLSPLENGEDYG